MSGVDSRVRGEELATAQGAEEAEGNRRPSSPAVPGRQCPATEGLTQPEKEGDGYRKARGFFESRGFGEGAESQPNPGRPTVPLVAVYHMVMPRAGEVGSDRGVRGALKTEMRYVAQHRTFLRRPGAEGVTGTEVAEVGDRAAIGTPGCWG